MKTKMKLSSIKNIIKEHLRQLNEQPVKGDNISPDFHMTGDCPVTIESSCSEGRFCTSNLTGVSPGGVCRYTECCLSSGGKFDGGINIPCPPGQQMGKYGCESLMRENRGRMNKNKKH